MRWLGNVLSRICLVICAAMALGVPVGYAALPLLPVCSWPVESTGQGILNVATQDTNTTYWFMPIDTSRWKSVVIQGIYPNARFFNFATYDQRGLLTDTVFDSDIVPDSGGSNPFTMAATGTPAGPSSPWSGRGSTPSSTCICSADCCDCRSIISSATRRARRCTRSPRSTGFASF